MWNLPNIDSEFKNKQKKPLSQTTQNCHQDPRFWISNCVTRKRDRREDSPTSRHQQRIKARPGGVFQSCLEQGVRELRGERTQGARNEGPRPGLARGASEKGTPEDPWGEPGLLEGITSALPQELPWVPTGTFWKPVSRAGNVKDPVRKPAFSLRRKSHWWAFSQTPSSPLFPN